MLEKLRRTYGDLLLSVGEGGLAASGALGNIKVRIITSTVSTGAELKLFFLSLSIETQQHACMRACIGVDYSVAPS